MWQAHADPAAQAEPAVQHQQFQDADGAVMSYLLGMNNRFLERLDSIDHRIAGLQTSHTDMGQQISDLRTSVSDL